MATSESLFKPLPATPQPPETVSVQVDGAPVRMARQASLAAGLLAAGVTAVRRSPVGGDPRAPYCMMGVCFECLVEVDGMPNQQACLIVPREGMQVHTLNSAPRARAEGEGAHA